jgi:hypothetical protein
MNFLALSRARERGKQPEKLLIKFILRIEQKYFKNKCIFY